MDTQPAQPSAPTPAPTTATPPPATPTPTPASKGWLWALGIALVFVFAYGATAYFSGIWPFGAAPYATPTPDESVSPTVKLPPATLPFDEIQVGTQMGAMTVVDIRPAYVTGPGPSGYIVELEGNLTITGRYTPFNPDETLSFTPSLLISDADSLSRIPRVAEDPRSVWFMFDNHEAVASALGNQGGTATVTINRYEINMLESAIANVGTFVSGSLDSAAGWIPFSSQHFTLSFKIPKEFGVRENPNHISVFQEPYTTNEIGATNSFLSVVRYTDDTFSRESTEQKFRSDNQDIQESQIYIDGTFFKRLDGISPHPFGGDNPMKITAIFFDASVLYITERPLNQNQDFDPIDVGISIVHTFRFTKNAY